MKSVIIFILGIFLLVLFNGCQKKADEVNRDIIEFFSGEHQIQKMKSFSGISGQTKYESSFFILAGSSSFSSTRNEGLYVCFSWKDPFGDYILSSIPYTSLKISLNEEREFPVVKKFNHYLFKYQKDIMKTALVVPGGYVGEKYVCHCSWDERLLKDQVFINKIIHSVTIECHPDDWELNIEMPF
jgi:hypothetical protein